MSDGTSVLRKFLRGPYNKLLRPLLPTKIAVYNGVAVKDAPLLDQKVSFPEYEGALIEAIREYGNKGERIVQVGGGKGVSAVAASRVVGPSGDVIVYEGGREYVEGVRETLELNDVLETVVVRNKIVGENRDVWGNTSNVELLTPSELPNCDSLVLDCEGAEQTILPQFKCDPSTLIVESHGELGSSTDDVKKKITDRGYTIEKVIPELPEKDIYVVVGTSNREREQ